MDAIKAYPSINLALETDSIQLMPFNQFPCVPFVTHIGFLKEKVILF